MWKTAGSRFGLKRRRRPHPRGAGLCRPAAPPRGRDQPPHTRTRPSPHRPHHHRRPPTPPHGLRGCQPLPTRQPLNTRGRADLRVRLEGVPDRLQLLPDLTVETGLQLGLRGVPLTGPRRRDRVDQRQPPVDEPGERLQNGRDDRRTTRRPQRHHGPVVPVQHDRRRDRRPRPLARPRQVRVVHGRVRRGEGEVRQLVVEDEPPPGDGDPAATGLLDGEGVGDDVAPLVGHRQMRGAVALVRRRSRLAPRAAARGVARVPRRHGTREHRVVLDEALARVREPLRQQFLGRHVLEGGVAHPAPAVGEGDPARLDEAVQVLRLARPGQVGPLQDVERLTDGRTAGGGRRHGVDAEAAVRGLGGRLEPGAVGGQVLRGQVAGAGVPARGGIDRRLVDGVDDVPAEPAAVDRVDALVPQLRVCAGEIGVLEGGADDGEPSARQEQVGGVREVAEAGLVGRRLGAEGLVDGETVARQPLGRLQNTRERLAAPLVECRLPGGGRARRADAQAAADGVGEGEGLAVLGEQVLVGAQRGGLAAVDGAYRAGLGVVVHEVAASTDAGGVGLGDAERGGRGDGGVDGVAALPQDLDAGGGGVGVDARDGAPVADGQRGFLTAGALRGGWRRRRSHRHHHGGRNRQDRQIPCDRATHPHLQSKAVRAA